MKLTDHKGYQATDRHNYKYVVNVVYDALYRAVKPLLRKINTEVHKQKFVSEEHTITLTYS